MPRPVLIDPADGPCEICAAWAARPKGTCTTCGAAILPFQNMGGNGFQSVFPDHYHLEQVGDVAGRRGKYAELCHECYRKNYAETYPDSPPPQLPLVFMDLNARHDPKLFRPVDGEVIEEFAE